ncbi:MAG: 4-(cytidine 5'-diphospho)-2-C-methyl-D-erythritol kinase [Thermodesulfobacteriota bacterium]
MEISAPAKINLYLDVLGRRVDGYHELQMLMCCIGLFDIVRLTAAPDISVSCDAADVPADESNIAHRAARCFFNATAIDAGVHIAIHKTIPVGAGLGGGSSNAAAVLSGLNRHFGYRLPQPRLAELARTIGADVPFFLYGRPAVATGLGEILTPFAGLRSWPIVLIYPMQPVSTAAVYKKLNLGLTKTEKITTKFIFESDWDVDAPKRLHNALEPIAFKLCPEIEVAKSKLLAAGAEGALMTGSGSAVYGLFRDRNTADRAYRHLSKHLQWQVFQTQLLTETKQPENRQ